MSCKVERAVLSQRISCNYARSTTSRIGAVSEQEWESATKLAGERTVLICFHVEGEMKILLDILYNVLIFFLLLCLFDVFTCFAEQLLEML